MKVNLIKVNLMEDIRNHIIFRQNKQENKFIYNNALLPILDTETTNKSYNTECTINTEDHKSFYSKYLKDVDRNILNMNLVLEEINNKYKDYLSKDTKTINAFNNKRFKGTTRSYGETLPCPLAMWMLSDDDMDKLGSILEKYLDTEEYTKYYEINAQKLGAFYYEDTLIQDTSILMFNIITNPFKEYIKNFYIERNIDICHKKEEIMEKEKRVNLSILILSPGQVYLNHFFNLIDEVTQKDYLGIKVDESWINIYNIKLNQANKVIEKILFTDANVYITYDKIVNTVISPINSIPNEKDS